MASYASVGSLLLNSLIQHDNRVSGSATPDWQAAFLDPVANGADFSVGGNSAFAAPAAANGSGGASGLQALLDHLGGPGSATIAGGGAPAGTSLPFQEIALPAGQQASAPALGGATTGSFSPENITLAGSNLTFHNTYGAGVTQAYHDAIVAAEHELQRMFSSPTAVTMNMNFDMQSLGQNFSGQNSFSTVGVTWAQLRAALVSHATSADDQAAVANLPAANADPSNGAGFQISAGLAQTLGLGGSGGGFTDNIVLNSDLSWNFDQDAVGVLEHEISEGAMGRIGGLGIQNSLWSVMDLFRFNGSGARDYTGGQDGQATYFSTNGTTLLTQFHNSVNAGGTFDGQDFADWGGTSGDAFGPGGPGSPGYLTNTDARVMDVIGWGWTGWGSATDDIKGNTATSATVAVNGSATGNIETNADQDWFAVNLIAGRTYIIKENGSNLGGGTLTDTYLRLNNSASAEVASNDDFTGNSSQITYTPTTSGTYYVDAGAYQALTGTYTVSVTQVGADTVGAGAGFHDFNKDGPSDILWRNSTTGLVVEWDMNTNRTVQSAASIGGDSNWSVVGSGDFNGDGSADLLWRNATTGVTVEWDMNGSATLSAGAIGGDTNWSVVGTGDFNGDGKADILWRNSTTGQVVIWDMNDRSVIGSAAIGGDTNWSIAGTGDFNGDGITDILWRNNASGQIVEWDMNANGTVASAGALGGDSTWSVIGTGDFNGDRHTDILWRNGTTGQVVEWLMNDRAVSSSAAIGGDANWSVAATGDFNQDGKTDIIWHNTSGVAVEWDMNGTQVLGQGTIGTDPNWLAVNK